jgi:hypothetical protein
MKLVFLCMFLVVGYVFGQRDFDFVINLKGDTLFGTVKDRKEGFREEQMISVRFTGEGYLLPKRFKPHQIIGYSAQGRVYQSFCINKKGLLSERFVILDGKPTVFLRCTYSDARIQLFFYDFSDDDGRIESVPYFLISAGSEMVRATQGLLGLKRNLLCSYFSLYPELVKKIKDKQINSVSEIVNYFREL